jgi:predicted permease
MLARASGREREIAMRGALGASPARLIRQLLSESVVLGALAGVAGLIAAAAGLRALVSLLPANTPRIGEISIHWPVFLFAAGASVLAGILFGLIPALKMASPNLREALHSGSHSVAGKPGQYRVSMVLVIGQIALSVVVITAAGLMLHSLWSLAQVNPGFRTSHIVTAEVSMDANACQAKGRCDAFFSTLLDRAHGLPGEEGVALTDSLPLVGIRGNYVYDAQGHPRDARQEALLATKRVVSPGYFTTLGMSLVRGRLLNAQDDSGASRAVVIDRHMADRLWPHDNPLGRQIEDVGDESSPGVMGPNKAKVVVGIVNNTHVGSLAAGFSDEVYLPMTAANEQPSMYVLLRTHAPLADAASELRQAVASVDPQVPVTRVQSLNEVVAASESAPRSLALLLLAFGALAVIIGGVGVYSLIAYTVNWRTREIGIRLALGAQRGQILNNVIRQSLLLSLGGCALGLAGAALAAQLLRSFLFGVSTVDPVTFCAVALLMVVLALVAAWIPARRAASVDPITTLRVE